MSVRVGRRPGLDRARRGQRCHPSVFKGASADGTRVFFETEESLVSTDTDTFRTST